MPNDLHISFFFSTFAADLGRRNVFMPIFVTIPVDVPPTLQITPEMLSDGIAIHAQEYVDNLAQKSATHPTMSYEELEQCIPLNVAFDRLREKNRQYYSKQA